MVRTHTWLFGGVLTVAVVTGVLAWRGGLFAAHPEMAPPTEDSLSIEGADDRVEARLRESIELTGFLRRGADYYVAIINSQVVEEGGTVVIELESVRHELRVKSISENRVVLRKL
jgi:hypothetical protein